MFLRRELYSVDIKLIVSHGATVYWPRVVFASV